MKLVPLEDRVIVEPITEEEKTKGGIYLPQTVDREKPEQGTVVSVGLGKMLESGKRSPLDVKVGDKVVFTKYGPDEIKVNEKKYLIVRQSDILAIIK